MKQKQTKKPTQFIGFLVDAETKRRLEELAQKERRSIASMVRIILEEKLAALP